MCPPNEVHTESSTGVREAGLLRITQLVQTLPVLPMAAETEAIVEWD